MLKTFLKNEPLGISQKDSIGPRPPQKIFQKSSWGDRLTFDACADLWPVLGTTVYYTGESGTASRIKLVSNLVLGLNRVALAEGLWSKTFLTWCLRSAG